MPSAFAGEDAAAAQGQPAAADTAITQGQTTAAGADTHAEQAVLEGEAVADAPAPSIWDNWLLWVVVAMWVWFLFGNKKRKAQRAQEKKDRERRESLQKGDRVVTIGRLHGKVVAFTDKTVTIKPDDKAEYSLTFDREALLRVLPRPGEETEAAAGAEGDAPAQS